jgi:hypothetical protein
MLLPLFAGTELYLKTKFFGFDGDLQLRIAGTDADLRFFLATMLQPSEVS